MKSERSSIRHALELLRRLQSGERLTVATIVAEGPFGEDAVRRHLATLEQSGVGVHHEGVWGQEWYYRSPDAEPSDDFTVLSLAVASTILSSLRGSELDDRLRRLVSRELVRADTRHTPGDLSRMFFAKSRMINPLGLSPDTVDRIAKGIFEQRVVKVTYEHFDGETNRITIHPYTLVFSDEGLYLYAHCVESDKTSMIDTERLLNVERVRGITLSRERFTYPPRELYDPERSFRDCIGVFLPAGTDQPPQKVVLQFNPRWHQFLMSHRWHPSQSHPRVASDRKVIVTFTLHLTQDLVRWVRSLGSDLEVLEPPRLARWIETGQDPEERKRWA